MRYGESDVVPRNLCADGNKMRSVQVASSSLNWLGWKVPWLRLFGNPIWGVQAEFVMKDNHLCYVSYRVRFFLTPDEWRQLERDRPHSAAEQISLSGTATDEPASSAVPAYTSDVWQLRAIVSFRASVTNEGSDEQQRRAFDFDLTCLSRLGGCRAGCEVMPSVWIDHQRKVREKDRTTPAEELNDPRCVKLMGQS